jgi:hypothetical protein
VLNIKYRVDVVADEESEYDAVKSILSSYESEVEIVSDEPDLNKIVLELNIIAPIGTI